MAKYTTDELLKLAESHYLKNEYDDALKLFLDNRDMAESSSLWHFNVGSLYLKKSSLGLARFHLEKAKDSFDIGRLAQRNIESIVANDYVVDISKSSSVGEKIVSFGVNSSVWDFSLIFLCLLVTNILLLRLKKITKTVFASGLIICFLPFLAYFFVKKNFQAAIVVVDAELREGPSKIYEENSIVPAGGKIIFSTTKDGWFLLDYPENVKGWVEGKNLRVIGN